MAGMQQGHDPATITNELLRYAAESGFGSPEEQNQVAVALTEIMNSQGYNSGSYQSGAAPVPPALGASQPADTGGSNILGSLLAAGAGAGAVAGGVKGAQAGIGALRSSMTTPGQLLARNAPNMLEGGAASSSLIEALLGSLTGIAVPGLPQASLGLPPGYDPNYFRA